MQGVIKKLVADRGFGFIAADGGDVFFHHSIVVEGQFEELKEGQKVEYVLDDTKRSDRGPRASSVKPIARTS
jgi:CspA family cold shock protein